MSRSEPPPLRFAVGFDLGLCTGYCVWDHKHQAVATLGTIDVRKIEDPVKRMGEWRHRMVTVLHRGDAVAYEEVRHMQGQGARWIYFQQGILMAQASEKNMLCAGVNVSTLKGWARRYGLPDKTPDKDLPEALKNAEDMQFHLACTLLDPERVYGPVSHVGEDEAIATWVAVWLADQVTG